MLKSRLAKRNGELRKLKKPNRLLEPINARRKYTASLYRYTLKIREIVTREITPKLPFWLSGGTLTYPEPNFNQDSLIDDIIFSINNTIDAISLLLLPFQNEAIQASYSTALEVASFNQNQFTRSMNSVLGVDIFLEEPWLEPQLELFANQNSELIKSLTETEMDRVSGIVQRGIQEGATYNAIQENIQKSFGITRRHARLIARDQTSKLNASLTKLRQQESGITEYIWQTSNDERVRTDHRAMSGKRCRWDDPTVYFDDQTQKWKKRSSIGGTQVHVGTDVNCFLGNEEVISFDTIKKVFRRFYSGEVVEIITEEGFSFKSTPNHPVLTQKGWVAINQVNLGDNIICAGDQGFNILEMNIQEKKTTFDNLFASLEKIFPFDTSISSGQFHGDISDQEVNVISIDCELISKWNASDFENFKEFLFSFSNYLSTQIHLSFDCSIYSSINRLTFSPESFISVFSQFLTLINSEHRNSIIHSFTSISNYDTLFNKSIFDNISTSVKSLRELFNAHSLTEQQLKFLNRQLFKIFVECTSSIFGSINTPSDEFLSQSLTSTIENFANMQNAMPFKIKTCRVVEKRSSIISAHVYNLETIKGYYGICIDKVQAIFHNCRCIAIPVIEGMFDDL